MPCKTQGKPRKLSTTLNSTTLRSACRETVSPWVEATNRILTPCPLPWDFFAYVGAYGEEAFAFHLSNQAPLQYVTPESKLDWPTTKADATSQPIKNWPRRWSSPPMKPRKGGPPLPKQPPFPPSRPSDTQKKKEKKRKKKRKDVQQQREPKQKILRPWNVNQPGRGWLVFEHSSHLRKD